MGGFDIPPWPIPLPCWVGKPKGENVKTIKTVAELREYVLGMGERKTFAKGDIVVCVATPYNQKAPFPGEEWVVIESTPVPAKPGDGMPCAAGEHPDMLIACLDEKSEEGFFVRTENSRFFALKGSPEANEAQKGIDKVQKGIK